MHLPAWLNAWAEFEPYREESRFRALAEKINQRIADAAGTFDVVLPPLATKAE